MVHYIACMMWNALHSEGGMLLGTRMIVIHV